MIVYPLDDEMLNIMRKTDRYLEGLLFQTVLISKDLYSDIFLFRKIIYPARKSMEVYYIKGSLFRSFIILKGHCSETSLLRKILFPRIIIPLDCCYGR